MYPRRQLQTVIQLDATSGEQNIEFEPGELVAFQSGYGAMPKSMLYGLAPFILLATAFLFYNAAFHNGAVETPIVKLSPQMVMYVFCPGMVILVLITIGLEVYHRLNPRKVYVTDRNIIIPKHRFTDHVIKFPKRTLHATIKETRIVFFELYEIRIKDRSGSAKTVVRSVFFRHFDDFATFAMLVADTQGQEWIFPGFLPGSRRGRKDHFASSESHR